MTSELPKYTIADLLGIYDISAHDLAELAGVHTSTVMRAMIGGQMYKTNETSAEAIAEVLGVNVEDIIWANGLSHVGRPAHTGRPITTGVGCLDESTLCPVHRLVLPVATNRCDYCA